MADAIVADIESSGIYQIRNLVNGKRYIGSAKCFRQRWAAHKSLLRKSRHHSRHLQNSWNKRGEDAFAFEVIEVCDTDELIEREQRWLDSASPEYNVSPTAASPLGVKHPPEFGRKVSERFKGKKLAPERVEKLREAVIESWNNPASRARRIAAAKNSYDERLRSVRAENMRERWADPGYRKNVSEQIRSSYSDERRRKTSDDNRRRWADPSYKQKMSKKFSGRVITEEQRAKISATLTGRPLSVETRKKKSALTDDQVREVRRMRNGGSSYVEIASHFGISSATVSRIILGKRYQWVV